MADVSSPIAVLTDGIFTQVTAGLESGYGLRQDGAIFSWGDNTYGQLGDDSQTQRDAPVSVIGGHRFDYIAAGWNHILGMKVDGSLFGWGDNSQGQLADGTSVPSSASSPQSIVGGHSFVKVDAGECHSMGLKADGSVWTWGCNEGNQLGYETFTGAIGTIAQGCGQAIDQNGVLWAWGANINGYLGDGTTTAKSSPVSVLNTGGKPWLAVTPGPFAGQFGDHEGDWLDDPCIIPGNCRGIAYTGSNETYGIKDEGNGETSLWCWGAATAGNLGNGQWNVAKSSPVSVLGSGDQGFWTAGVSNKSCALDKFGQLWCWGDVGASPLNFGDIPNSFNSPVNVANILKDHCPPEDPFHCTDFIGIGHKVLSMGNGGLNGLVLDLTGEAWLWGSSGTTAGHMCQGPGTSPAGAGTQYGSPIKMTSGIGWPNVWLHACMGEDNSIWLTAQGVTQAAGQTSEKDVFLCGSNTVRAAMEGLKFGGGGPTGRSTPTVVIGRPHNAIKVDAAWTSQTFGFLRADGSLWMWGENNNGECGVGNTSDVTSPTSVLGSGQSYSFVDFQLGGESGCVAIDTEGQVWGWGQWGHVGDHTTTDRTTPTRVSLPAIPPETFRSSPTRIGTEETGPFYIDIAAGNQHNLALKEDGSAFAWGSNTVGQLGDGTIITKGAPTSVAGGHSFIDIAAGIDYSYALKENAEVWAWGDNTCGKLGDDSTTDTSTPTVLPILWNPGNPGGPPGTPNPNPCCYSSCPTIGGSDTVNHNTTWVGTIDTACLIAGTLSCSVSSDSGCTGFGACTADILGDEIRVNVPLNACGSFTVTLYVTQDPTCVFSGCITQKEVRINNTGQGGAWSQIGVADQVCSACVNGPNSFRSSLPTCTFGKLKYGGGVTCSFATVSQRCYGCTPTNCAEAENTRPPCVSYEGYTTCAESGVDLVGCAGVTIQGCTHWNYSLCEWTCSCP